MKTLKIIAMAALTLGLTQMAYADHHGKDGMHGDRSHAMENADTNKDGAISHDEFTAAHQKMAETMFTKMDANKDGKIDKAERDAMKEKMGDHCKMKGHKMDEMAK
ncbi:MAG: EF-hand domain-containing protein [Methylotenera sp.]|uniref:EF-hand domain-containing protein n=1 Tax=Methylotenera sp. TaxID=2051956 RepID=UPI00248954AA|nr:EF-hand domain-containing protein [Methylotenera sp.]MDI1310005.1 EF-hand domain-containing protein [Methylotenera sp.]